MELTMDDETRAALEASIEHWKQNVAAEEPYDISVDGADCPLCEMFNSIMNRDSRGVGCNGCPVADRTGQAECNNSPYYVARKALWRWQVHRNLDRMRIEWRQYAQAEVDFLISLRPKE